VKTLFVNGKEPKKYVIIISHVDKICDIAIYKTMYIWYEKNEVNMGIFISPTEMSLNYKIIKLQ